MNAGREEMFLNFQNLTLGGEKIKVLCDCRVPLFTFSTRSRGTPRRDESDDKSVLLLT